MTIESTSDDGICWFIETRLRSAIAASASWDKDKQKEDAGYFVSVSRATLSLQPSIKVGALCFKGNVRWSTGDSRCLSIRFWPGQVSRWTQTRGVRHQSNLLLAVAWIRLLIHLRTPLMTWSIHAFRGNESISAAIASISQQHPGNWIRPLMDKNGFVSAAQLPSSTNMYACHNPKEKKRDNLVPNDSSRQSQPFLYPGEVIWRLVPPFVHRWLCSPMGGTRHVVAAALARCLWCE